MPKKRGKPDWGRSDKKKIMDKATRQGVLNKITTEPEKGKSKQNEGSQSHQ